MNTVHQHHDRSDNTLYFRLNVCGMPADPNVGNNVKESLQSIKTYERRGYKSP